MLFLTCPLKNCFQQLSYAVHPCSPQDPLTSKLSFSPQGVLQPLLIRAWIQRLTLALDMLICSPFCPGEQDGSEGPCYLCTSAVLQVSCFSRIILHYLISIKQSVFWVSKSFLYFGEQRQCFTMSCKAFLSSQRRVSEDTHRLLSQLLTMAGLVCETIVCLFGILKTDFQHIGHNAARHIKRANCGPRL